MSWAKQHAYRSCRRMGRAGIAGGRGRLGGFAAALPLAAVAAVGIVALADRGCAACGWRAARRSIADAGFEPRSPFEGELRDRRTSCCSTIRWSSIAPDSRVVQLFAPSRADPGRAGAADRRII